MLLCEACSLRSVCAGSPGWQPYCRRVAVKGLKHSRRAQGLVTGQTRQLSLVLSGRRSSHVPQSFWTHFCWFLVFSPLLLGPLPEPFTNGEIQKVKADPLMLLWPATSQGL